MSAISLRIESLLVQIRQLRGRHPALWPPLPRASCALALLVAVTLAGGWLAWLPQSEALEDGQQTEQKLRKEFEQKFAQAQHLDQLRRQKAEVEAMVRQLERQLPGKSEMDALLAEVSQAGVSRGLQFEMFKPGQPKIGEFHAELPIEIRLSGGFHALAGFVSDVANMPRIVAIDRMGMTQQREGLLSLDCVAHAFRYLEPAEAALSHGQDTAKKQPNR